MTRAICRTAIVVACLVAPRAALAQGRPYWGVTVATGVAQESNLFAVPTTRAERDLLSRTTPALELGTRSERLTVTGQYSFDAVRFMRHPMLNRVFSRQSSHAGFSWHATRRVTFAGTGEWLATDSPGELNIESLLTLGRTRGNRVSAGSTLTYLRSATTTVTVGVDGARDMFVGATTTAQRARFILDREIGRQQKIRFGYELHAVGFTGVSLESREIFHVLSAGWTRMLARSTSLSVDVGPRIGTVTVHPEWTVRLQHVMKPGELSLGYSRTLTTSAGVPGMMDVRQVVLGGTYRPMHRVTIGGSFAFADSREPHGDATARATQLVATVQAARRVSVVASGRAGRQLVVRSGAPATISSRTLSVAVTYALSIPRPAAGPSSQDSSSDPRSTRRQ